MKKLLYFLLLALALQACTVKQNPDPGTSGGFADVTVNFNLSFDKAITDYRTVTAETKTLQPNTVIRNFIHVYAADADGQFPSQDTPDYVFSWQGGGTSFTTTLPAGRYRVLAWTDEALADFSSPFWNADDFCDIRMEHFHEGSTDAVRAYRGESSLVVNALRIASTVVREVEIPMTSPMGKFQVLATDKDQAGDLELDGITVRFTYTQYLPSSYSVFLDKPVDSQSGVSFISLVDLPDTDVVRLGYDYVFTNGGEATIPLLMEVLAADQTVQGSFSMQVPVVRGKLTTIQGDFFTGASQSSIKIDPGFDGTITVEL